VKWTPAEVEYLRSSYATTPRAVLVERLRQLLEKLHELNKRGSSKT
jgi:hypothetical protein